MVRSQQYEVLAGLQAKAWEFTGIVVTSTGRGEPGRLLKENTS